MITNGNLYIEGEATVEVTHELDVRLGGHSPTSGVLEASARSPAERAGRAIGTLLLFAVVGGVAFFIPPHIPWLALALIAGGIIAVRQGRSEYEVQKLTGTCPRCGNELTVEPGEGVRLPLKLTCFQCHHEPVFTIRN